MDRIIGDADKDPYYADIIKNRLLEDIDFFDTHNIPLTPLKINLSNNTKANCKIALQTSDWWNTKKNANHTYEYNRDAIKDGNVVMVIRTGISYNICIIDFDVVEGQIPTEESLRIKELCLKSNTLCIKTPRGGYHFVFKCHKDLPKGNTNNFKDINGNGNIDFIVDNLVFFGYRDDGDYTIVDKTQKILSIPDDVINILYIEINMTIPTYENLLTIDGVNINLNPPKKYDIKDKTLKKLLTILDDKYLKHYTDWMVITSILKRYYKFDIWDEWSQKGGEYYNQRNNIKIWECYDVSENRVGINYIVHLINSTRRKYNEQLKDKDKDLLSLAIIPYFEEIHYKYKPLSDANQEKIDYEIDERFLKPEMYKELLDSKNAYVIWSQLGTAKTTSFLKYCVANNIKILSVYHLITIGESQLNAYKNIIDDHPRCYDRIGVCAYDDERPNFNDMSVLTTCNSIQKVANRIGFEEIGDYVIYLDEIHSMLNVFFTSETMKSCRREAYSTLMQVIKQSKGILASDGVINDTVINMFNDAKIPIKFFKNIKKPCEGIPLKILGYKKSFFNEINKQLVDKKYFVLCSNQKRRIDEVKEYLFKKGVKPEDILTYTAAEGAKLVNIQTLWQNKYVLYSPSIVQGVDFKSNIPIVAFMWYCGICSLSPEDMYQQLIRNRNISSAFSYMNDMTNEEVIHKSYDDYVKFVLNDIDMFKHHKDTNIAHLLDHKTDPESLETIYTATHYTRRYCEILYMRMLMDSNPKYVLCDILEQAGFVISYEIDDVIDGLERVDIVIEDDDGAVENYVEEDEIKRKHMMNHLCGNKGPPERVKLYNYFKKIDNLINEYNVLKNIINIDIIEKEFKEKIELYRKEQDKLLDDINIETKTEKQILNEKVEQIVNDFQDYKDDKKMYWEFIESYKDTMSYLYSKKEAVIMKKAIDQSIRTDRDNYKRDCIEKVKEINSLKSEILEQKKAITKKKHEKLVEVKTKSKRNKQDDEEKIRIYLENKAKKNKLIPDFEIKFNDWKAYINLIKDLYTDPSLFMTILNIKTLFIVDDTRSAKKFVSDNTRDATVNCLNNASYKYTVLKNLTKKYLPEIDLLTYKYDQYSDKYLKKKISITNVEFNMLQSHHTYTIYTPENKYSLLKKLITLLKDIIGKDCYITDQVNIKENDKTVSYSTGCIDECKFKAYISIIKNMNDVKLHSKNDNTWDDIVEEYLANNPDISST
tara:strand:+ start:271 stop:3918 length:3648 start_codon:yes stop_codon:yes gene_type:complete